MLRFCRFAKLTAFLKNQNRTYKPKKANVLQKEDIETFLREAPDDKFLLMKVVLLMGVSGACRCDELIKMTIDDIQDKGRYIYVLVPDSKTHKPRSFTIVQEKFSVDVLGIYKKYASLRPNNVSHRRFFLTYRNRKCTVQPIGINTLARIPRLIAAYLKLPHPETYTGHCYRRSSATILANAGGDLTAVKRLGGWRSSTVAEGYIEESLSNKLETSRKIWGECSTRETSRCSNYTLTDANAGSESALRSSTSENNATFELSDFVQLEDFGLAQNPVNNTTNKTSVASNSINRANFIESCQDLRNFGVGGIQLHNVNTVNFNFYNNSNSNK